MALRLYLFDPCYGLKVIADAFLVNAYQKYTCKHIHKYKLKTKCCSFFMCLTVYD